MKKGFTLIELLVVISIIALLSSVVLAAVGTVRAKGIIAAGQVFEGQMYQAYGANAVAVWNFDEGSGITAHDTSGNNNNLTLSNVSGTLSGVAWASQVQAFRGNSALIINGNANSPAVANITGFNPNNGSISFWINLTAPSNQYGIFCNSSNQSSFAGTSNQFCIYDADSNVSANFIQVEWNSGGVGKNLATTIPASSVVGKWTNVAVSWSGSSIAIYITGSQVANSNSYVPSGTLISFSPITTFAPFFIA